MNATDQIRKKLGTLPHQPGIYLMRDRFGTVIYVGKARDLRKRVSQYFQRARRGWDLKFKALVEAIHDFDVHVVRSDPEAVLLEGKLIKEFHPRYNVSFRDDKQFLMLKVNLNDPIPRFTLTRLKQDDGARYFGPFPNSSALRTTLALVRRRYHLRGCRPLTPTARDYRHCLYAHLRYCTAPCIGNVSSAEYRAQVRAACEFLEGQCAEMQEQLAAEMRAAAAAQEYERAARLRDLLSDLQSTTRKLSRFPRVPYRLPRALDPEKDLAELARVLGLPAPPPRIEGFDISNISGTFKVAALVSFRHGRPDRANYRRFQIKTVAGQDDFASVAEVVRRRYTRVLKGLSAGAPPAARPGGPPPAARAAPAAAALPDLILIDGGKGQLSAARAELEKLGLGHIPLIGLAKEFEEIYRAGRPAPLRLPPESGALKLLQRVRDESHRFANTYNAQLRLRKISESLLDEFPHIGQRRKAALLKKFGSVQRLRRASVEQIAEVPGFGGKTAAELKAFLAARPGGGFEAAAAVEAPPADLKRAPAAGVRFNRGRMNIQVAVLCDAATDDNGKLNLLGAFDTIYTQQLPAVHPQCSIALRVTFASADEGRHQLQVNFVDADGRSIAQFPPIPVEVTLPDDMHFGTRNFIVNIQQLKFDHPGLYAIDIALDGRPQASIPLLVRHTPPGPA